MTRSVRAAWRWFLLQPTTVMAVVGTIALGVGAVTAVYAIVDAVVLRALPVREPDRLVWLWNARVERDRAPFSALDLADYRDRNAVIERLAPFVNWTANLTGAGDAERLEGVRVDPLFFDVMAVAPAIGRTFRPDDEHAQVAVLTDALWRRRFGGDRSIVGTAVPLNGAAYTVVGVLPRGFVFPFRDAEIAVPLSIDTDPRRRERGAGFLRVVARLKPGVSAAAAKADLDRIAAQLRRDYPDDDAKKLGVNVYPLSREIVGDARAMLLTLFAACGLLLLVATANIASLVFGSLASRRRELALRVALGATRMRVAGELAAEIAVLASAGGAMGLLIARLLSEVLVWWGGSLLPRLDAAGMTMRVAAFSMLVTAATALVCAVAPAWLVADAPVVDLADAGRTTSGTRARRVHRLFVVVEIAAAVIVVTAALLTVRSFAALQAVDPGFAGTDVLSVQLTLPANRYRTPQDLVTFADRLRSRLLDIPDVHGAAAVSLLPLSGLLSTVDYTVVGQPPPRPDEVPQAHFRIVTPEYFHLMGIGVSGREFDAGDRETTGRVAVISRTLAERHWPGASPIGAHITFGSTALEIVGVCADVKQFGLDSSATADLYVPLRQMPPVQTALLAARMYWVIRSGSPAGVADSVRAAVRSLDPDVAASSTRTMPQVVAAAAGARRFGTSVMAVAGVAAFVLGLMGTYAVAAFSVGRRVREIGVRVALGATPGQLMEPLVASELRPLALGLVLGGAGAAAVSRVVSGFLFAIHGFELASTAVVAAALGVAAAAAIVLPIHRAAHADPLVALRTE